MPATIQFLLSGFLLSFSFVVNYVPITILAMSCIISFLEKTNFLKNIAYSALVVAISYSLIWISEGFFSLYFPISLAQVSAVIENTNFLIYLICLHAIGYSLLQSYLLFLITNATSPYMRALGICIASNVISVIAMLLLYYKVL